MTTPRLTDDEIERWRRSVWNGMPCGKGCSCAHHAQDRRLLALLDEVRAGRARASSETTAGQFLGTLVYDHDAETVEFKRAARAAPPSARPPPDNFASTEGTPDPTAISAGPSARPPEPTTYIPCNCGCGGVWCSTCHMIHGNKRTCTREGPPGAA